MATRTWMLELGPAGWRIHARRDEACAEVAVHEFAAGALADQAPPIGAALLADGYCGEPIMIALDSPWCLAATLPITRPQELRDRQTMAYRLEEWIPWGAEEFVADFVAGDAMALAVAVECEPLAEFLGQLETEGVSVASIVPMAILAGAEHFENGDWPAQHVVLFERQGEFDLVAIDDGTPTRWLWLPAGNSAFRQELAQLTLETGRPSYVVAYGLDTKFSSELGQSATVNLLPPTEEMEASPHALALSAAERIVNGRTEPLVDLKRGPFGRRRGNAALRRYVAVMQTSVAILLAAASAIFVYQGHAAAKLAEMVTARQTDVFRNTFPTSKVPVGVRSRLESELAKLRGLKGSDTSLPESVSAIAVLHHLLSSLPTDRRFRLLEIRIEEGRLYLDGEVRAHSDAVAIAQRLRAEHFEVSSPRTQRLDDKRVSLRITATAGMSPEESAR